MDSSTPALPQTTPATAEEHNSPIVKKLNKIINNDAGRGALLKDVCCDDVAANHYYGTRTCNACS